MLTQDERRAKIASYGRSYNDLIEALKEAPPEMWKYKPTPKDWSVHEILIHLGDSEANSIMRFRKPVAEPGSTLMVYNQDGFANTLHYHNLSTDNALALLKGVRTSNLELLQTLPDAVFANTAEHPANGTMSLDDILVMYEAHLVGHIRQIREVVAAYHHAEGTTSAS